MSDDTNLFVPQPKRVTRNKGIFTLSTATAIALLPDSGEVELFAAKQLQEEILAATGLLLPLLKVAQLPADASAIVLSSTPQALSSYLRKDIGSVEIAKHGDQAYLVEIQAGAVIAYGNSTQGLYYAVQTLRQVARIQKTRWQAQSIADWPALSNRGLMLDVSRGKVPTLETVKLLIDQLSLYKMNVLQFYTEHTFVFPHHPRIGQDCGSLSGEDILELDAYARPRYVQLMPNLQSFGHCEHILNLPEYMPLAESAAHWSLCPVDERTYTFVDELYGDLLPAFSSKVLNIGCDETFDLGKGRSNSLVQEKGLGRVYLEHILRLREIAAKYGVKIQLWGDILLHHPELVAELPEDVTLLDWHYEAADDYPSTKLFGSSGRTFWVCPGTSSWNTLYPRIENANDNIRTLARVGAANGATGLLNTDWGDGGHYQPIGQCWYGYIYGAEQAWSGGQTDDAVFDASFGRLFFGDSGEGIVKALRALGRLNALPGMATPNSSQSVFALLDEPLVGPVADKLPEGTLDEMLNATGQIEAILRDAYSATSDPVSVEELLYTTRLMAYTARKIRASQQAHEALANLAADPHPAQTLHEIGNTLAGLEAELPVFVMEFRRQWLRRARNSEIKITLSHFAKLQTRFAAARAWLAQKEGDIRSGQAPNINLGEYAQEAASYEILYQGWTRHLREIGITWD